MEEESGEGIEGRNLVDEYGGGVWGEASGEGIWGSIWTSLGLPGVPKTRE